MDVASPAWMLPEPTQGSVAWTRTWRVLTYDLAAAPGARLYLALAPDCLAPGYEAVFPLLESRGLAHRHARSPEALRTMEAHPVWAGKAVVVESGSESLAADLDALLAGRGLSGPSVVAGARPVGGQSGLLFIQQAAGGPVDDRRQHLAKLLGD